MNDFLYELDFTISVCNKEGEIIYMNKKCADSFGKEGGLSLVGSNILDCHPEPSKSRLKEMMLTHETQSYMKGEGQKKRLIHQTPVYKNGEFDGYIECIIPLPGM